MSMFVWCPTCGRNRRASINGQIVTTCIGCTDRLDRSALIEIALAKPSLEVDFTVGAGAVVVTNQRVVRHVVAVDGNWFTDEFGERWHLLQVERVRTGSLNPTFDVASREFGEAA